MEKKQTKTKKSSPPKKNTPANTPAIEQNAQPNPPVIEDVKPSSPRGAPPIIKDKRDLLIEAFRRGYTDAGACSHAEICTKTFYNWKNKGLLAEKEGYEDEYLHFLQDVRAAIEESCNYAVTCWRDHFKDDWRAAKEYLERKDPDNWNLKQKVHVTVEGEIPVYLPMKQGKINKNVA